MCSTAMVERVMPTLKVNPKVFPTLRCVTKPCVSAFDASDVTTQITTQSTSLRGSTSSCMTLFLSDMLLNH